MLYRADEGFDITSVISQAGNQKRLRGRKAGNATFEYKDLICAFDIETTLFKTGNHNAGTESHPHIIDDYVSIMYIWQMQIGDDITIYGREWSDFRRTMDAIVKGLHDDERICFFVHNLGYEWQWLRDRKILGDVIDEESVFLVKARTPVKFIAYNDKVEFRCSYLHTNMSLDEFTQKMHVQHGKLSGEEFDYSKQRFSWTELTTRELEYCVNDVLGLVEAITKECAIDGDNLYTLPLTSTGYVRRDMKKALRQVPYGYIKKLLPNYHTYTLLREAFRGGNTHASRFMANRRLPSHGDGVFNCSDEASAYPFQMVARKVPVSKFNEIAPEYRNIDHIVEIIRKGKAVLCKCALWNVKLKNIFEPVPYISRDKCSELFQASYDNGRVLRAEYLMLTVTDVDLMILLDMYDFDIEIIDAEFADYGYLPEAVRNVVRHYFESKTMLKAIDGIVDNRPREEIEFEKIMYDKSKALLNACYGMMAQNPVKLDEIYKDGDYDTGVWEYDPEDKKTKLRFINLETADVEGLDIYKLAHSHNIEKSTFPYQWGVWITAHARYALQQMINACGENFIYCDTDSVYYSDTVDLDKFNRTSIRLAKEHHAYAVDKAGITRYMGVAELDKTGITAFKTLGAKKYAYIDKKGLHITIAGVSKLKGAEELTRYAKQHHLRDGLDALTEEFVFRDAGGTESVYNDTPIESLDVDGHSLYIPSNIAIKPSTYEVSLKDDYAHLLKTLLDNDLFRLYELNRKGAQLPTIPV